MAYSYLEADNLSDALNDSEEYMKPFYQPLDEIRRVTRGKPGKVPKGKPRVTDGTLAGWRRETPKQIIQQLPSGKVFIKDFPDIQDIAQGILTDLILPNANSGGTPYSKAKKGVKSTIDIGSSWAECFFNRRGTVLHADYRLKHFRDVLFEKGKVSEFDTNYMIIIDWMTESDVKALIWMEKQRKLTKSEWDLKNLQLLLDEGAGDKDDEAKTEAEKKAQSSTGYFKIAKFYQIGVNAPQFVYAPAISKKLKTCYTKDKRGIIPVHGLVPEDDDENPLGEPLAAISIGKQNLLDFDMQMYQYNQGMQLSPTVKAWGNTPAHNIRLAPDNVIKMNGTKATDDIETISINNDAINNYANNSSYIKTQIYNEQGGSNDSSISADAGAVGYSKTSAGVNQQESRQNVSKSDLRKLSEQWHGRIFETLLNIQFAESMGSKDIDLEPETMKRYNMEKSPQINYDEDYGVIKVVVEAGSSEANDNVRETEGLTSLLEIKGTYQGPIDDKFMLMYNQIVKNAGVDDPEKLLYTEDEVAQALQMREITTQQAMEQLVAPPAPAAPEPALDMPMEQPMAGPAPDMIEEDRMLAMQQLLAKGMNPQQAEAILAGVENGSV